MDIATPGFGWTFKKDIFNDSNQSVIILPNRNNYIDEYKEFPSNQPYEIITNYLSNYLNIPESFNADEYKLALNESINKAIHSHLIKLNDFNQLNELISNKCSNQRRLKWDMMIIKPNTSFRLHAHPNIELIYVVKGVIHEYRLTSDSPKKEYQPDDNIGPNLSITSNKFIYRSVGEQQLDNKNKIIDAMFVNEIGSVHLTFTRDEGATLFVLWSGSHANIQNNDLPIDGSLPSLPESVAPYEYH